MSARPCYDARQPRARLPARGAQATSASEAGQAPASPAASRARANSRTHHRPPSQTRRRSQASWASARRARQTTPRRRAACRAWLLVLASPRTRTSQSSKTTQRMTRKFWEARKRFNVQTRTSTDPLICSTLTSTSRLTLCSTLTLTGSGFTTGSCLTAAAAAFEYCAAGNGDCLGL